MYMAFKVRFPVSSGTLRGRAVFTDRTFAPVEVKV